MFEKVSKKECAFLSTNSEDFITFLIKEIFFLPKDMIFGAPVCNEL